MTEGPEFDARIEQREGYVVVVVRGELDVGEHQRAKAEGFRFVVSIAGARQVERLFELCGLKGAVATVEDPDALSVA